MGILSKEHNDSMDKISEEKTSGKQQTNFDAVVMCFNNMENKLISSPTEFNIFDFYPSLSMDLLNVSHAHKSLLFNEVWPKKRQS